MSATIQVKVKVDKSELVKLQSELNGKTITLNVDSGNAQSELKGVKDGLKSVEDSANKTQGVLKDIVKNASWYAIRQGVLAVKDAFSDALQTIKEVDSELAVIQKVTDFSDEQMKGIADRAYEVASAYGVAANEYLESVGVFARAGYKEAAEGLGELATKTQLVGDVSASIADQFLLAVDAAWKYNGSVTELSQVLDEANIVENNFATSIQKISEGFPNVASVASMATMSVEETIAAMGTITAVTQQSGTKAATALRALILNILGDTNTAFETEYGEFVKWTDNETQVLRELLNTYAKDVVNAAEATGTLINPIEAIRALSNAMKDGKLTAAELEATLQGIGGKLRTNQLVALVDNMDMFDDMMDMMADSAGSADKEIGVMLDTWESKSNILANTWTEFVNKFLNADIFKGGLDAITNILKAIGGLDKGIALLASTFGLALLPKITKFIEGTEKTAGILTRLKDGIGSFKSSITSLSGGITAALAIGTTAITVAIRLLEAHQQKLHEATQEAIDTARAQNEAASNALENNAKLAVLEQSYKDGEITAEQYNTALFQLAEGLEGVGESAESAAEAIRNFSAEQIEDAQNKAVVAMQNSLDELHGAWSGAGEFQVEASKLYGFGWNNDLTAQEEVKGYVEAADELQKEYDELQKKKADNIELTWQEEDRLKTIKRALNNASEEIDHMRESYGLYESSVRNLSPAMAEFIALVEDYENKQTTASEEAKRSVDELFYAYDALSKGISDATAMTEWFAEVTKTELDDAFKGYANIYEQFFEDWTNGLQGSDKVRAAIETFFSVDQIADMISSGMNLQDIGNLLANDFYQSIFSAKGEDRGAIFAEWLIGSDVVDRIDEQGNRIIEVDGKIAAALSENENGISVAVEDFDLLAQAMAEFGLPVSPEMLTSWLQALGMYSIDTEITATNLAKIAEGMQAVNDAGEIDLDKFIIGLQEAGYSVTYIQQYVDAILRARDLGEEGITVKVNTAEGETEVEHIGKLLKETKDTAEGNPTKLDADAEEVERTTKEVEFMLDALPDYISIPIRVELESGNLTYKQVYDYTKNKISNYQNATSIQAQSNASGTDNAPEGLSLVNEEGAEIIWDGKSARIAGNGKPTITYLNQGDKVYTAKETKDILGGISEELLHDGIGAYAMGTSLAMTDGGGSNRTRVRATSTATSSRSNTYSGNAGGIPTNWTPSSSGRASSSSSGSSGGSSRSSSTKEKDEQLEALKDIVTLRKSELSLSKAQEESEEKQIEHIRAIQAAIKEQVAYMQAKGASQSEINNLMASYYDYEKDIADMQKKAVEQKQKDELQALKDEVSLRETALDLMQTRGDSDEKQIAQINRIIDALRDEYNYQKSIGASKEDLHKISIDIYEWEEKIKKIQEEAAKAVLDKLKDEVSLRESKLDLMETQGKSESAQIKQIEKIKEALADQIEYMKEIGASQEDINDATAKLLKYDQDIAKLEEQRQKKQLERFNNTIALQKSALDLMEERGDSNKAQIEQMNRIIDTLRKEYDYQQSIGASKKDLHDISTEIYQWEKKIADLQKQEEKDQLQKYKDKVSLRQSELDLMQAQGASVKDQIKKIGQIKTAISNQYNYMIKIGASQEELNALKEKQLKYDNDIAKLQQGLWDDLQKAIKNEISDLNDKRNEEKDVIQQQIDALKDKKDLEDEQLKLEEKRLAVAEAEAKLQNAQLERTVRMYNEKTKQWEWVADSKAIQDATEDLQKAKEALADYEAELDYNAQVDALKARQDAIDTKYDKTIAQWEKITDSFNEEDLSIDEALSLIGNNATKDMKPQINAINALLKSLGYKIVPKYDSGGILKGLGGIKATSEDEIVLPPSITKAMLTPTRTSLFDQRMAELETLYGNTKGLLSNNQTTTNTQNVGALYQYGNVALTQEQAERTTVAEFVRMAKSLNGYSSAM